MSDYGVGRPLWDDHGATAPSAFDVPVELAARLRAWQDHFEEHFHFENGWRSAQDATVYVEQGKELQRLLTKELGRSACVELDLWPVAAD